MSGTHPEGSTIDEGPRRCRVLFVDDEPAVLDGLRRSLRAHRGRLDMRFVTSGAAALEAMREVPADVVVSDHRMPEMDGGELLAEVRRLYPSAVRLVLSGQVDAADAAQLAGIAHQFLAKPCDADEVLEAIESVTSVAASVAPEGVRNVVARLPALFSPPASLLALNRLLRDDASIDELTTVVGADVALSTKLLQLVNSSFFVPRTRVTRLRDAILRLGQNRLQAMVAVHAMGACPELKAAAPRVSALNERAVAMAALAERLCPETEAADAYCLALLLEVGHHVFVALDVEEGVDLSTGTALPDGERSVAHDEELCRYGVTHADVGASLLELWGFPRDVCEVVRGHTEPGYLAAVDSPVLWALHRARCAAEVHLGRLCTFEPIDDLDAFDAVTRAEIVAWALERQGES